MVPQEIRQRVHNEIKRCIDVASSYYGREFNIPSYDFNLKGTTGGRAWPTENRMEFNATFLLNHTEEYIARTVPHEVAHIIDRAVYGYEYTRRGKVIRHGTNWKSVMRVLGVKDLTRCHSYDVTPAQQKVKSKFHYKCKGCGADLYLGPVRHRKHKNNKYWHSKCGKHSGELVFVGSLGQVTYSEARQGKKGKIPTAPKRTKPIDPNSKKAKAIRLYKWNTHLTPKDLVELFMSELNMSLAGARTYLNICRKEVKVI